MDCLICALNGLWKGKIILGDKENWLYNFNVTKAVSMFLDDSRAHNPIAKCNPVAKIDWTLAAPNQYPKARYVVPPNLCQMNKPSGIEYRYID